jgi:hypothetical protein
MMVMEWEPWSVEAQEEQGTRIRRNRLRQIGPEELMRLVLKLAWTTGQRQNPGHWKPFGAEKIEILVVQVSLPVGYQKNLPHLVAVERITVVRRELTSWAWMRPVHLS